MCRGGGGGWGVGLGLGSHQRWCPTARVTIPHQHDPIPPSLYPVSQPSRLRTVPEPHRGAGKREIPLCPCGSAGGGGFRAQGQAQWHAFVLLQWPGGASGAAFPIPVPLWQGLFGSGCLKKAPSLTHPLSQGEGGAPPLDAHLAGSR